MIGGYACYASYASFDYREIAPVAIADALSSIWPSPLMVEWQPLRVAFAPGGSLSLGFRRNWRNWRNRRLARELARIFRAASLPLARLGEHDVFAPRARERVLLSVTKEPLAKFTEREEFRLSWRGGASGAQAGCGLELAMRSI
jgi:hypothetical protein